MENRYPALRCSLLRARDEWQCRRATEQRDELASLHSITSSARASSVGGTCFRGSVRRKQRQQLLSGTKHELGARI
jgi:hypothetical protein